MPADYSNVHAFVAFVHAGLVCPTFAKEGVGGRSHSHHGLRHVIYGPSGENTVQQTRAKFVAKAKVMLISLSFGSLAGRNLEGP